MKKEESKVVTITKEDALFPMAFKAIGEDCPQQIYALGNVELLKEQNYVAIIGARKATNGSHGAGHGQD